MKVLLVSLVAVLSAALGEETLVAHGGETRWRYLDAAAAPDSKWITQGFDDGKWKTGVGPLGYGESGLGSTLSFGADKAHKPMTAWFRHAFEVKDAGRFGALGVFLRCDDGAVVYLNGREIARENMPAGAITAESAASEAIDEEDEATVHRHVVPAKDALRVGANVIAVEVHQAYASSSDLFLDLELKGWAAGEEPKPEPTKAEQRLAAIESSYAAAPGDMETAYAWVRAHVEARKGLTEKVVARALPKEIPAEWRFIVDGPKWPDTTRELPRAAALADLDYLEEMIANCYSYADRRGVDWRGALDAVRASITGDIRAGSFLWRVERFMTVFGDPHSRFRGNPAEPEGMLPVTFVYDGDRVLAVKADRTGFLNDEAPYVTAIEEVAIGKWLAAAGDGVAKASPQYQRRMVAEALSRTEELAWQVGLKPGKEMTLALASADGKKTAVATLPVGDAPRERTWPPTRTKKIGEIGYLRLMQMSNAPAFIARLNRDMAEFKDTRGLVIDVRGNGGGTQDAIKTLLPYFMKPGEPMKIINIAAYRLPLVLPKPNPEGFLGLFGRGLHPATSKEWSEAQRGAIAAFMKTWEPKWKLPAGKFSDWHFMGISRETNPEAYSYEKPVVVLQDEGCFSATDNFLGALKGHPGVTLLGTTSGGGSGRMASYMLPNAKVPFTLCQMASFATTGRTYDGNGVEPDVVVERKAEDALSGAGDAQLQAALERLGVGR